MQVRLSYGNSFCLSFDRAIFSDLDDNLDNPNFKVTLSFNVEHLEREAIYVHTYY